MYDSRQNQNPYGNYPIQGLMGYSPQQGGVGYTQAPIQYVPQGQQMIQQPQPRPMVNLPQQNQPQENIYTIRARYIGSPEDIRLGEVPMDGSMPLFLMQDHSAVIGKYWDKDAQLKTVRYIRDISQESVPESQKTTVQTVIDPDISDRLGRLEHLVNRCVEMVEAIPVPSTITTEFAPLLPSTSAKSSSKKVSNNG